MRDHLLLALILSLGMTGCNSFQGLTGKKSSSDAAAVTAPVDGSGDAAKGNGKSKACPVEAEAEDDGEYSEEKEAEKKAAKEKEKADDEEMGLTHDGTEHESDDDCTIKESSDD